MPTWIAGAGGLKVKLMKFKLWGSFLAWALSKSLEVASNFVFTLLFILKVSSLNRVNFKSHETWL